MGATGAPTGRGQHWSTVVAVARQPIWWCAIVGASASVVALTAPATRDPIRQVAIALIVGGLSIVGGALTDRRWLLMLLGAGSVVAGSLLAVDDMRFLDPVLWGMACTVVLIGVAVGTRLWRSGANRLVASLTGALVASSAVLFRRYDTELLPLGLGLPGLAISGVVAIGVVHAVRAGASLPIGLQASLGAWSSSMTERGGERESGEVIAEQLVFEGPEASGRLVRFVSLMVLSSTIAALGVLVDSTAVVIGAMLIAPLLTPLMAMSLSLVAGRADRLVRSVAVVGLGVLVPIVIGVLATAVIGQGTDAATNAQIVSRSTPTLLDLAIAVAAGCAGAYAASRRDVADSLPGVAIAIALVPPLAVVGIAVQLGDGSTAAGALVLFATNALAILGAGAAVFVALGVVDVRQPGRRPIAHWSVGFAASGVGVLWLLVANSADANELGFRTDRVAESVERWDTDDVYELVSVDVDGSEVVVSLDGPQTPDDVDALAAALDGVFGGAVTLDLRVTIVERTVVGP